MAQELNIRLDPEDKKPLYRQIYEYIRGEIRSGGLEAGERLPSTRSLASGLHVARSTTELAYSQLLSEGYVRVKKNSGYYVNEIENLAALYFGEPGRDGIYSPEHNLNDPGHDTYSTGHNRFSPRQNASGAEDALSSPGRAGTAGQAETGEAAGPDPCTAQISALSQIGKQSVRDSSLIDFSLRHTEMSAFPYSAWKKIMREV